MMARASLLLLVVLLNGAVANAVEPIALHAENPHYFTWRGKPTLLITSGEHYGALLNLDFDYTRYLETLQQQGLNHTRTFSGVYREIPDSFGITDNPLAPKPERYVSPWARSDQPGYFDGGNKFDLTRWDAAYFARLRDFMSVAQRCGVVVELTLFCPMYNDQLWQACPMNSANNVNGIGACPRVEAYTGQHVELLEVQLAVTRKIVSELREFDNLYYEVCNEPYFGGVTTQWQHAIVDEIVATESEFEHRHLISLNVANGRAKVRDPHPAVSIFNFHYCVPPDVVALNDHLGKVIGENETGFRGQHDLLYRTEGWNFILAGGALYNNLDYSFTPHHPTGDLRDYQSPGGGSPELRKQLAILKSFVEGFNFTRMKPASDLVLSVEPPLTTSVLAEPGRAYAIYLHVPIPDKPKDLTQYLRDDIQGQLGMDLPTGTFIAEWVDTKTGKVIQRHEFTHAGGRMNLQTPRFANDIALRIAAVE